MNRVDFVDVTLQHLLRRQLALGHIAHVTALLSQLAVGLLLLLALDLRNEIVQLLLQGGHLGVVFHHFNAWLVSNATAKR